MELEKLIPINVKWNKKNKFSVQSCNKKGVFKTIYNGKSEYYFTTDAYIEECKEQNKKPITKEIFDELGITYIRENKNFLIIKKYGLNLSGYVNADGKWWNKDRCGFLSSASPVNTDDARAFIFSKDTGILNNSYGRDNARPCLYIIDSENEKHSYSKLGKKPNNNLSKFVHKKDLLVVDSSKSDTSSIGLFDSIVERAESYGAKLGASAGYKLGKILS